MLEKCGTSTISWKCFIWNNWILGPIWILVKGSTHTHTHTHRHIDTNRFWFKEAWIKMTFRHPVKGTLQLWFGSWIGWTFGNQGGSTSQLWVIWGVNFLGEPKSLLAFWVRFCLKLKRKLWQILDEVQMHQKVRRRDASLKRVVFVWYWLIFAKWLFHNGWKLYLLLIGGCENRLAIQQ